MTDPAFRRRSEAPRALLSAGHPWRLQVHGSCMAPLLRSGASIHCAARRRYWPGDLVVAAAPDGRLLVHRLLGCLPGPEGPRWLTQADSATHPDGALPRNRILGRVVGGEAHPAALSIPWWHRLWACGRLLRHALRAGARRLGTRLPRARRSP